MDKTWLVILLGTLSTVQVHLAKALERQGIEVFDQLRARLGGRIQPSGGLRKPAIYTVGVILNNTVFIYPLIAQPYGPPALFTSMFGLGLVALLVYAALVLRERLPRSGLAGAAAIISGTLTLGFEQILRPPFDRSAMDTRTMFIVLGVFLALAAAGMVFTLRRGGTHLTGLVFGVIAGAFGGLDPFFKGVGQNLGGTPHFLPGTPGGWAIFLSSFVIGFSAFALTQWGFARKAGASVLVSAYNAAYVLLPLGLQAALLPGYPLHASTVAGAALIVGGMLLMGTRRPHPRTPQG